LLPRKIGPKAIRITEANRPTRVFAPQNGRPKAEIAKKQKAKGNGGINITRVKCYNC